MKANLTALANLYHYLDKNPGSDVLISRHGAWDVQLTTANDDSILMSSADLDSAICSVLQGAGWRYELSATREPHKPECHCEICRPTWR